MFKTLHNLHYEQVGKEVRCIEDELPFEIPNSWQYARLGSLLLKLTDGTHSTPKYKEKGVPFVSVKDISTGHLDLTDTKYISIEEHEELYKRCDPQIGDILLSKVGTTGIAVLVDTDVAFSLFVSVALLKFNHYDINPFYLIHLLSSPLVQNQCKENTKGVGNKNWVMRDIAGTLVVIPPYIEQLRIVDKIKELEPLIDKYKQAEEKLFELNSNIKEQLKKSILQYAIEGKLVPQDPNDEPASVLLERIHEEKSKLISEGKIKKDKNESIIYRRDNSYYEKQNNIEKCIDGSLFFDIPDNWQWCRLGTIFQHNTGKALNSSNTDGVKRKYITTSNLYWNRFELDGLKEMYFKHTELDKCSIKKGDLLVCEGGDIGRAAIWNEDYSLCFQNHIHRLRPYVKVSVKYFYLIFFLYKVSGRIGGKGVGIQGLSSNSIHLLLLPIPPLATQNQIVHKYEQILTILS